MTRDTSTPAEDESVSPSKGDSERIVVDRDATDDGGTAWLTVRVNNTTVYDGAVTEGTDVTVETVPLDEFHNSERDLE